MFCVFFLFLFFLVLLFLFYFGGGTLVPPTCQVSVELQKQFAIRTFWEVGQCRSLWLTYSKKTNGIAVHCCFFRHVVCCSKLTRSYVDVLMCLTEICIESLVFLPQSSSRKAKGLFVCLLRVCVQKRPYWYTLKHFVYLV